MTGDASDIFKIAALGLCGVFLAAAVKGYKPEFALFVIVVTSVLLLLAILTQLTTAFSFLGRVYSGIGYGQSYFLIVLKVLAVAYVADFAAQLCRDAGETSVAGKVELAGKVIIFCLALPVMLAIVELIESLLPMG
ncbi:MAG: SpoIIIAC/SpoIIIAD family protein [Bacillota bacterium]|nr:SpoIIIAC/SpoIIIAD family protein [Bacillota bacterium]